MQLEVGAVVEGKVTGITKFGAFVELSGGKTGMVHISEISNTYVKEISDHLSENQIVKVKILSVSDDGKVSMSIKKAVDNPPPPSPRPHSGSPGSGPPGRRPQGGGRSGGWNPRQRADNGEKPSFEDMMSKFKQTSEDKMSDLKRNNETRRGTRRR